MQPCTITVEDCGVGCNQLRKSILTLRQFQQNSWAHMAQTMCAQPSMRWTWTWHRGHFLDLKYSHTALLHSSIRCSTVSG